MSTKSVPGSVVRGRAPFMVGHFQGDIGKSEDTTSRDGKCEFIGFKLENITMIDAEKEPGQRPHFIKIMTSLEVEAKRGKTETLLASEVDAEDEDIPYGIRASVTTLAQLALSLGRAELAADGVGVEFADDIETFIEELRNDTFEGETVEFIVSHRAEKKDGKVVTGGRTFVDTQFPEPEDDDTGEDKGKAEEPEDPDDDDPEEPEDDPPPAKRSKRTTKSAAKGSGKARFSRRGK